MECIVSRLPFSLCSHLAPFPLPQKNSSTHSHRTSSTKTPPTNSSVPATAASSLIRPQYLCNHRHERVSSFFSGRKISRAVGPTRIHGLEVRNEDGTNTFTAPGRSNMKSSNSSSMASASGLSNIPKRPASIPTPIPSNRAPSQLLPMIQFSSPMATAPTMC